MVHINRMSVHPASQKGGIHPIHHRFFIDVKQKLSAEILKTRMRDSYNTVVAQRSERRREWRKQTGRVHQTENEDQSSSPLKMCSPTKKPRRSQDNSSAEELQASPYLVCNENQQLPRSPQFTFHPDLKPVPTIKVEYLFISQLRMCQKMINFQLCKHLDVDLQDELTKDKALNQLIDFITDGQGVLTGPVYPEVVDMITSNLFRTLPPRKLHPAFYFDTKRRREDEWVFLKCWPRLEGVYKFMLYFLESAEFKPSLCQQYIDHKFVIQLLELFDSRDPRERTYLRNVVLTIYNILPGLKIFIRNQINYIFLRLIYETEHFNGVNELLEIVSSILDKLELPLNVEDHQTLAKVLVPLHTARCLRYFRQELARCLVQYINKDPSSTTVEVIVMGLIKYWPVTCGSKQLLFLDQFHEILSESQPHQWLKVHKLFLDLVSIGINSSHGKVADRALDLWDDNDLTNFFASVSEPIEDFIPTTVSGVISLKINYFEALKKPNVNLIPTTVSDSILIPVSDSIPTTVSDLIPATVSDFFPTTVQDFIPTTESFHNFIPAPTSVSDIIPTTDSDFISNYHCVS